MLLHQLEIKRFVPTSFCLNYPSSKVLGRGVPAIYRRHREQEGQILKGGARAPGPVPRLQAQSTFNEIHRVVAHCVCVTFELAGHARLDGEADVAYLKPIPFSNLRVRIRHFKQHVARGELSQRSRGGAPSRIG